MTVRKLSLERIEDSLTNPMYFGGVNFTDTAGMIGAASGKHAALAREMFMLATQLHAGSTVNIRHELQKRYNLSERHLMLAIEAIHSAAFPKDRLPYKKASGF